MCEAVSLPCARSCSLLRVRLTAVGGSALEPLECVSPPVHLESSAFAREWDRARRSRKGRYSSKSSVGISAIRELSLEIFRLVSQKQHTAQTKMGFILLRHRMLCILLTKATVRGSLFGPEISVARGHSRE